MDYPGAPPSTSRGVVARAQPVSIRTVWPNEAADFTPWLSDHLGWLAEDLELGPLTLEAMEVPVPGGRWLDLLATDAHGRVVAIENQYGVTDHDHLTRALAYAVAMQANDRPVGALVVIAEEHRDEFIAVADYLNECAAARAEQGIPVFLVKVSVEQILDSPPAVRFTAIARPNDWQEAARQPNPRSLISEEEYLALLYEPEGQIARAILAAWTERPERWITTGKDSLVLYARNHRVPQGRCNVASFFTGTSGFWLNPGRLVESRAFTDSDMEELSRRIVADLPSTTTQGGKGYYLAFPLRELDPGTAVGLLDWISDKLIDVDGGSDRAAVSAATVPSV
jgi:hypothetical protein